MGDPGRRAYLRSMGIAGMAAVGGCAAFPGNSGTDGTTTRGTTTDRTTPTNTDVGGDRGGVDEAQTWLVPHEALGFEYQYRYDVIHPVTIAQRGDAFDCAFELGNVDHCIPAIADLLRIEDVSTLITVLDPRSRGGRPDRVSIATGPFDVSGTDPSGYDRIGEYRGFTRYESGTAPANVLAIREGAVLYADIDNPTAAIDTVIDARTGNGDRLFGDQPGIRTVTEQIGAVTRGTAFFVPQAWSEYEQGFRVIGQGVRLGASTSTGRIALVFDSPESVSTDKLEGSRAPFVSQNPAWSALEIETRGRVVTATTTAETGAIQDHFIGASTRPPLDATLSMSYDGSRLSISHSSGDSFETSAMVVSYGETYRRIEREGRFETGDTVTVEAPALSSGDRVLVVWDPPCASRRWTLAEHTIG